MDGGLDKERKRAAPVEITYQRKARAGDEAQLTEQKGNDRSDALDPATRDPELSRDIGPERSVLEVSSQDALNPATRDPELSRDIGPERSSLGVSSQDAVGLQLCRLAEQLAIKLSGVDPELSLQDSIRLKFACLDRYFKAKSAMKRKMLLMDTIFAVLESIGTGDDSVSVSDTLDEQCGALGTILCLLEEELPIRPDAQPLKRLVSHYGNKLHNLLLALRPKDDDISASPDSKPEGVKADDRQAMKLSSLARVLTELESRNFRKGDPQMVAFHKSLVILMHDLASNLEESDPRFRNSTLHGIGSHFSDLRTSAIPSEQDWMLTIEMAPDMTVERVGEGHWEIYLHEGGPSWAVWSMPGFGGASLLEAAGEGRYRIEHRLFFEHCYRHIRKAMAAIALPPGFQHGGILFPVYSGVWPTGSASTLNLIHEGQNDHVAVDVTIGITVDTDTVDDVTRREVLALARTCHLPPTAPVTLHMIPSKKRTKGWALSTAAVEARLFAHLGRDSPLVQATRDLKNLVAECLNWGPTPDCVAEVNRALEAWGDGEDPPNPIAGLDTAGVAACVSRSLETGIVFCMTQRTGEEKGKPGWFTYVSKSCLVYAAIWRKHREGDFNAGEAAAAIPAGHDIESCGLCRSLLFNSRRQSAARIHPAVAAALYLPVTPWRAMNTCFIKYVTLRDIVAENKKDQPTEWRVSRLSRMSDDRDLREGELSPGSTASARGKGNGHQRCSERAQVFLSYFRNWGGTGTHKAGHPILDHTGVKVNPVSAKLPFSDENIKRQHNVMENTLIQLFGDFES